MIVESYRRPLIHPRMICLSFCKFNEKLQQMKKKKQRFGKRRGNLKLARSNVHVEEKVYVFIEKPETPFVIKQVK